jgi:hypothetical protein
VNTFYIFKFMMVLKSNLKLKETKRKEKSLFWSSPFTNQAQPVIRKSQLRVLELGIPNLKAPHYILREMLLT